MNYASLQMSEPGRKPPPRRPDNQDRLLCRTLNVQGSDGFLLAIADGITNCPSGGSVANWVVTKHLGIDAIDFPLPQSPSESLRQYLEGLHLLFTEEFSDPEYEGMLASGATLSVVLMHGHTADCLWAGDSPIYHSRLVRKDYETRLLTRPDHERDGSLSNCFGAHASFSLRHCQIDLNAQDILTVTSDGIQVNGLGISHVYNTHGFTKDAMREMFRLSRQSRFWDDLSVAAAQCMDS